MTWMTSVSQDGTGWTAWPTVGVVGIVKKLSEPSRRWHTDSENFLQGLRLVNEKTKSKFGKSNGGKITRWPIKYPHVKKNAQRPKGLTYPASAKYPYENDRTITSNRSVEHTDSACQSGPQAGQRHLHGRHHTLGKHDREAI